MRARDWLCAVVAVALLVTPGAERAGADADRPAYRKDELLVRFKQPRLARAGFTPEAWATEVFGADATIARRLDDSDSLVVVKLPINLTADTALFELRTSRSVTNLLGEDVGANVWSRAERNVLFYKVSLPDDTCFADQWPLNPDSGVDIHAVTAWDRTKGEGATVAIIDTGIASVQPELYPQLVTHPLECAHPDDGADSDGNGFKDDCHGFNAMANVGDPIDKSDDNIAHGTHVAGIVAAAQDHAGIVGVSPGAKLVICKALDDAGSGSAAEIITCLNYVRAVNKSVRIAATNNSYASVGDYRSTELEAAIAQQAADGILFVTASGNNGWDIDQQPVYPAAYDLDNIVTVGSFGVLRGDSGSSNLGVKRVDLVAPGLRILGSQPPWATALCGGKEVGGVKLISGTSMAAPHVTGVAALIAAAYGNPGWQEIKRRLVTCGLPDGLAQKKTVSGLKLDAAAALDCP
ncbi:MAG: S8 family serine peptidase [Deltaproteobacteria bacterium]|nr:S8 family serine peptidase [Deltaproteobacteria bacterium]